MDNIPYKLYYAMSYTCSMQWDNVQRVMSNAYMIYIKWLMCIIDYSVYVCIMKPTENPIAHIQMDTFTIYHISYAMYNM